jgi:hypothetical protein
MSSTPSTATSTTKDTMLRNRKDYPSFITPKATVAWAQIDEPDYEYKDEGEFHIRVRFDPDDAEWNPIREAAEALLDEAFKAKRAELQKEKKGALLKKLHKKEEVFTEELDRESGDPTGKLLIRAGKKFRVEVKNGPNAGKVYEFTPDVFDARGKKLKKRPRVGSGSEVKLSIRVKEYFLAKDGEMGISYELEAVQIIKLVQGGSRDAASYGFAQEDGDALEDEDTGGFGDEGEGFTSDDDEDGNSDF